MITLRGATIWESHYSGFRDCEVKRFMGYHFPDFLSLAIITELSGIPPHWAVFREIFTHRFVPRT
jgi:hypothetical protein